MTTLFLMMMVGVPLLLLVLPTMLLLFSRGVRPLAKGLWVLLSVLPIGAMFALDHHRPTLAPLFYVILAWAVYFLFLWFGRDVPATARRSWRRVGRVLATAVFLGLAVWGGIELNANRADHAATHEVFWPLDRAGARYVRLCFTAHYGGNEVRPACPASASTLGGMPNQKGGIGASPSPNGRPQNTQPVREQWSLSALWPDMVVQNDDNYDEFQVPGGGRLMRVSMGSGAIDDFEGKHFDALQYRFDTAAEHAKWLCVPPARIDEHSHAICHDLKQLDAKPDRFGLKRLGADLRKYPDVPEDEYASLYNEDIYYSPALGNGMRTVITCMNDAIEAGKPYGNAGLQYEPQCTHAFVFKPLNAEVTIAYRRVYLKDWQAIQVAWERLLQSFIVEGQRTEN